MRVFNLCALHKDWLCNSYHYYKYICVEGFEDFL